VSEWETEAPASRSTADQAREGTRQVTETAREQAQAVLGEAGGQTRQAADRMRLRVTDEANTQTRRFSENLRSWSEELASIAEGGKPDSPARDVAHRIAASGQQAADYLDQHGVQGVLDDIKAFARRRPAAFLAGAALAGFVLARATKAASSQSAGEPGPRAQVRTQPPPVASYTPEGGQIYEPAERSQSALGVQGDRTREGM
jgi:hypothetical protein